MSFKRAAFAVAGVAGVLAFTGSALTATSTIDKANVNVGSVAQSVAGVTVTNVDYAYTAATDTTTSVTAKAEQLLDQTAGTVQISVNGGANQACAAAVWTDTATVGVDDGAADFSTITCDISDTANVTSVRFIVEG